MRHQKEDSTGTTRFVYDGQAYLAETDGSNVIRAVYTNEPDAYGGLISQRRDVSSIWTPSYYHFDAVGSTRMLTNSSQNSVGSYLYTAFGEQLLSSMTANPFRYIGLLGYYLDENTGIINVRQRFYDPELSVWVSRDPLGYNSTDPNLYRYVINNPLMLVDPTGHEGSAHHWVPRQVTINLRAMLSLESITLFNQRTSATSIVDGYDSLELLKHFNEPWRGIKHSTYNISMEQLLREFAIQQGQPLQSNKAGDIVNCCG